MLVIHLAIQIFFLGFFCWRLYQRGIPALISTLMFGVVAIGGTFMLYSLVRRANHRDPHWLTSAGRLSMAWRTWGVASCMGWMITSNAFNQTWGHTVISLPLALLTAAAFCAMMIGLADRIGDERRCAECDYPALPGTPASNARCPECGISLTSPESIVIGRKQRNPRLIAAGVAVFAIGLFSPFWTKGLGNSLNTAILSRLPTSFIIHQAFPGAFTDNAAFQELTTRKLSPSDAQRVAILVSQTRIATPAMIQWLEQSAFDPVLGTLEFRRLVVRAALSNAPAFYTLRGVASALCSTPDAADAETRDEWFGSMLRLSLHQNADAKIGQPLQLLLSEDTKATLPQPGHLALYAVVEVRFGNQVIKSDSPCPLIYRRATAAGTPLKIAEFIPSTAGPTTAEVTLWLAYTPFPKPNEYALDAGCPDSLGLPRLRFTPDGAPIAPKRVIWTKRRTIEQIIDVAPQ